MSHRTSEAVVQEGKKMAEPKKRWCVSLEVSCETEDVLADSADEAVRIATRRVENRGGDGSFVVIDGHAVEVRYERPRGTDRYAAVAEEIRFAEDDCRWLAGDGCWWWTNGHAAVRCEYPSPSSGKLAHTLADAVGRDHKRDVIEWKPARVNGEDIAVRVAKTDKRVIIDDRYARLVECGYPDVEWHVAEGDNDQPWTVPMLAYSGDTLVAVVMGRRPDGK